MSTREDIHDYFRHLFYTERFCGFECNKGWLPLLTRTLIQLDDLVRVERQSDPDYTIGISQVKEKWGGLTIYTRNATDAMDAIINAAENESYSICEKCGKPGHLNTPYSQWRMVRCDECFGFSHNEAHAHSMLLLVLHQLGLIDWTMYRQRTAQLVDLLRYKYRDEQNKEVMHEE
jgi:hypothetical protein